MDRKLRKEVKDIEKRLQAGPPADPAEHAKLLDAAGNVFQRAGRHPEAIDCFGRAVDLHRRLEDPTGEAGALVGMSTALRAEARFAEAGDCCRRALDIATELGWENTRDLLQWRIAACTAADLAGIDVPDNLVKAAMQGPEDGSEPDGEYWVYEVDEKRIQKDHAPAEAIIRAWQVGPDRLLTGLVIPNTEYREARRG